MEEDRWAVQLAEIRTADPELADKLAMLVEKRDALCTKGNVYGERYSERQIELSMGHVMETEVLRARILNSLKGAPKSVPDLAQRLGLESSVVLTHLVELRRRNRIVQHHIEERTPYYGAVVVEAE